MVRWSKALALLSMAAAWNSLAAEEAPSAGIHTPGVQIPFSAIAPEATFSGAPAWLLFTKGEVLMPAATGEGVARITVRGNQPGTPLSGIAKPCGSAVAAFESWWIPDCGSGSLVRLDPKEATIQKSLTTGAADIAGSLAATSDSLWMLSDPKTTLSRIDPGTDHVVAEVRLPAGCKQLTPAGEDLWVLCPEQSQILRINPLTNLIDQRVDVAAKPLDAVATSDAIWLLGADGNVNKLDLMSSEISKTIDLQVTAESGSIAFGEGNLWVSVPGFPLARIDMASEKVTQQFWGDGGGWLEYGADALWISAGGDLVRLDPKKVLRAHAD